MNDGRIEVEQIHGYGFRVSATDGRGHSTTMFDVTFEIFEPKAARDLANAYALRVGELLDVDTIPYGDQRGRHWSSCVACSGETFHRYATCEAEAERAGR